MIEQVQEHASQQSEQNEQSNETQRHETQRHEKQSAKQKLLSHPDLWRAGQLAPTQARPTISTGFEQLDTHLSGNGWPAGGLTELLLPSAGIGELRLMVPALRTLSQTRQRWLAWVNPPFIPYAPALQAAGIDSNKILLIHPRNHADALWALERACKSGSCASIFGWLDETKFSPKDSQRLQLAAQQGNTLACLFRPASAHEHTSMAELRLALRSTHTDQLQADIIKRRGGWPIHDISLPLDSPGAPRKEIIQEQLNLWHALQADEQKSEPMIERATFSLPTTGADNYQANRPQVH